MSRDETYQTLLAFGIDHTLAHEAANRYLNKVEAAADWCFGAGSDWKPDPVPEPPKYDDNRFEHHEMAEEMDFGSIGASISDPPALPPRRPPRPVLGSNNPFNTASQSQPRDVITIDDDDNDDDFQRAIRLSQQIGSEDATIGNDRDERERSVRATAPPPSPDPVVSRLKEGDQAKEEGGVMDTLFGPSTKEEEGATTMIKLRGGHDLPVQSKEEEDLNRAIQDSLMTASFHSASATQKVDKPNPLPRQDGAPPVFFSESGDSTYAAMYLQAMYAIPQVRDAIFHFATEPETAEEAEPSRKIPAPVNALANHFKGSSSSSESFIEADSIIGRFTPAWTVTQLPPKSATTGFLDQVGVGLSDAMIAAKEADPTLKDRGGAWDNPQVLTRSQLVPPEPPTPNCVNISRYTDIPYRVCPNLSNILWRTDAVQSLEDIAEVLNIFLDWNFAERRLWEIEERIVLDRFMIENLTRTTQIRALEAVAKGNHRRLKEKLDHLTTFQGNNFQDSISAIIKHYEANIPVDDQMGAEFQSEVKAKLQYTLETLQAKSAALKEEIAKEQEIINGSLFETDDPEYNKHAYALWAILMHDGVNLPGKHLYAYVRNDEGKWWKVVEHEIFEAEWEVIKKDQTGMYMGGGPYALYVNFHHRILRGRPLIKQNIWSRRA